MMEGKVKWFSDQRGFGFIEANNKDYFVHYKEIQSTGFKSLGEGVRVQFEPSTSPKGNIATKVNVLI
jgi:CspA family cold shock protein